MLPRIATPVTVPTPSPQEHAGEAGTIQRPSLSAESLANLRAAVVLRLLEAMRHHIEQGDKGPSDAGNAARQLLDILFEAMNGIPYGDGKTNEAARRLALLLARLPAEARPAMERLLTTVISAAPTRVLMEIIRSPGGPEAQRLALALLTAAGRIAPAENQSSNTSAQRFATVETQLIASAMNPRKEGTLQTGRSGPTGDGRSLQAALIRLFEGAIEPHPEQGAPDEMASGTTRSPRASHSEAQHVQTSQRSGISAPIHVGAEKQETQADGGIAETFDGSADIDDSSATRAGEATAKQPLREVRATQDGMLRRISAIVANLSEDDALVLRLILQAPLPELPAPGVAERRPANTSVPTSGSLADSSDLAFAAEREQSDEAVAARTKPASRPGESSDSSQAEPDRNEAAARTAANAGALPERPAERALAPAVMRDGVPVAFVPYLPAQDEVEVPEMPRVDEGEEEELSEDSGGSETGQGDSDDEAPNEQLEQEDDPDLERRRQKVERFVSPPGPGDAFYQKLGDYWI